MYLYSFRDHKGKTTQSITRNNITEINTVNNKKAGKIRYDSLLFTVVIQVSHISAFLKILALFDKYKYCKVKYDYNYALCSSLLSAWFHVLFYLHPRARHALELHLS